MVVLLPVMVVLSLPFIAPLWTDSIDYSRDLDGDNVDDDSFYTKPISDSMKGFCTNAFEYSRPSNTNAFDVRIQDRAASCCKTSDLRESEWQ